MSATAAYGVNGMTSGSSVQAVSREVHDIPGVLNVEVDLVEGGTSVVRIVSEEPLPEDTVREAVDEAGYELVGVA